MEETQDDPVRNNENGRMSTEGHWHWLVLLGVLLVVLGALGIGLSASFGSEPILLIGWFLLAAGVLQSFHALSIRPHRSLPLDIVSSLLSIVTGVAIVLYPLAGGRELTIIVSPVFIVHGLFRLITATAEPIVGRVSVFACGVVTLYLGFHLRWLWPDDGTGLIGLFVSAELAVSGWSLAMRGIGERRLASHVEARPYEQFP